ncbi:T9SS type A sorting domain-containing protein [Dyadobacter jiangsuensis]|uniref:Putative secreted protein (Por secretion system target) n=1 Tax=Dyadobacter jiangsuensis TaxID=1591085 RepID=A0A2P8G247_9BACT|nr:T9SS type A sorting domain-containing protein [Dyadobacter jiangsuensis]PSL28060.1 putative secreted protein (Por secretion system target) [Dyadobacter jiangsuensis]
MRPPLKSLSKIVFLYAIFQTSMLNVFAQNWNQISKVTAKNNGGSSDRSAEDSYAYSVAISGSYAIVGGIREDSDANGLNNLSDAGAAYILFNDGGSWVQIKKITAPVRGFGDAFGLSVAIDGDYAVVAAFLEDEDAAESNSVQDAGSTYIFKKDQGGTDNWGMVKKITAPARNVADQFGSSVSVSGEYIIVGAFNEDEDADELNSLNDAGSAYIFGKDQGGTENWGLVKKIVAGTRAADDWFGYSVSIHGDYAVVGAYREDEDMLEANTLSAAGAAYVFGKDQGGADNWGLVKKLTAAVRAANDNFGSSVSVNGDYLIVGAPSESEDASEANSLSLAGAAYIFKKDQGGTGNWGQFKKIVPAIRAADDYFGFSVSISDSYAIVGAQGESEDASEANTLNRAGGAYVFRKDQGGSDNWGQEQKIVAAARAVSDDFGISVATDGAFAIVGAWQEDEDALDANTLSNTGSAYIFHTNGPLPVTLADFQAVENENQALLSWTTTMETNSAYFDIQKSGDAHAWQTIGRVLASVNSEQLRSYSFVDSHPFDGDSPGAVNLYRLKMADIDGSFSYSRIVSLSLGNARRAVLYPNPVSYKLFCNPADVPKIESVTMMNSAGQIVSQSSENLKAGISVDRLTPGIYVGQIRHKAGTVQYQKIVVVR